MRIGILGSGLMGDAGPLRIAQLAYETKDDPELAYRFERFRSK